MKIAHLTSVHPRYDTRILRKMCCSLTALGKVYLVCAEGKSNEVFKNEDIIDVGKSKNKKLTGKSKDKNNRDLWKKYSKLLTCFFK